MEENKKFEIDVITRLTKIETMLRNFEGTEEKAQKAYNLSMDNKEEIEKLKDNNRWLFRTSVGAIITTLIGLIITIVVNVIRG